MHTLLPVSRSEGPECIPPPQEPGPTLRRGSGRRGNRQAPTCVPRPCRTALPCACPRHAAAAATLSLAGLLVLSACSVGPPSGMTGPLPTRSCYHRLRRTTAEEPPTSAVLAAMRFRPGGCLSSDPPVGRAERPGRGLRLRSGRPTGDRVVRIAAADRARWRLTGDRASSEESQGRLAPASEPQEDQPTSGEQWDRPDAGQRGAEADGPRPASR